MSMSRDEGKGGRTIEKFNRLIQFFAQTENVEDLDRRRDGLEHAAKIVDQVNFDPFCHKKQRIMGIRRVFRYA